MIKGRETYVTIEAVRANDTTTWIALYYSKKIYVYKRCQVFSFIFSIYSLIEYICIQIE